MIREKKQHTGSIIIDLTGPDGNAYALIGYASRFAKQLDLDHKIIIKEMTSGDYENLLKVFDNYINPKPDSANVMPKPGTDSLVKLAVKKQKSLQL